MKPVHIVGFDGPPDTVPWNNDAVERWGFNSGYALFPHHLGYRFTRFFELHLRSYFGDAEWAAHRASLQVLAVDIPVYLPRRGMVPGAVTFPRRALEQALAVRSGRAGYHAGSFDWLVAYAIHLGAPEIHLHGVNFARGGEPISARPCLEYWLGVAEGLGIATAVWGDTDLFRIFHLARSNTPYGFAPFRLIEDV